MECIYYPQPLLVSPNIRYIYQNIHAYTISILMLFFIKELTLGWREMLIYIMNDYITKTLMPSLATLLFI